MPTKAETIALKKKRSKKNGDQNLTYTIAKQEAKHSK